MIEDIDKAAVCFATSYYEPFAKLLNCLMIVAAG